MKKLLILLLCLICVFAFAACGEYDDTILLERIAQLEDELAVAKSTPGPKGDTGATGPQGPKGDTGATGGGLVGNPTPDKVYQLGETVSYYSNGLKLFDIKVTKIRVSSDNNRTVVEFVFIPYFFYPENDLGNSIGAILLDNSTQIKTNSTVDNLPDGNKSFIFNTLSYGQKTLYVCLNSVNMYIPFAVYSLNFV